MNKLFPLSTLAMACVFNPLAHAQADTNPKLEEIIVTSSRVPMPLREIGTSVSAITGAEIQQRGFNSLYEVLRSQPSVAVSNSGGPGNATALRIRGEEGFRTQVRLDGINISDTGGTQVSPNLEHLLSSGIQRVEILRGPQGLMYGADAGGIINIFTEAPRDGFGGQVSAEGGRYGTEQLAANIGGGNDSLDFNLSAVDFETDGFSARTTDTELRDEDGYQNTTLHGRLGWNVSDALRLEIVGHDVDGANEFDNCYSFPDSIDDCNDSFEQSAWRAAADYNTGAFTNKLSYNIADTKRNSYAAGELAFFSDGSLETTSYLGSFAPSDDLRLVYGVDLETQTIDDGTFDSERKQDGYYAEYQGSFNNSLFVTAGVRYDDNEDFGSHTSYRISGAYLFDLQGGELKLKGTYGTGFRAPSLYELAYNNGDFAYPPASDITMQEEQSEGYDIGVNWFADSGLYLEVVYFDQTVSNEIFFDLANFSGYLQGNGDTDSTGIELIGELPLFNALTISANYTYNDTDNATGTQRIRRPKQLANIGVDWRGVSGKLTLGFNVRGAYDALGIDGSKLNDYQVADINASFEILQGLELYGRVENLFDEEYEEVPTYNTSGTAAYAGIRYAF